jgi:serine/threonine protein kinase
MASGQTSSKLWIVMEYADGGDLGDYILNKKKLR